jgi:hypothetical protein
MGFIAKQRTKSRVAPGTYPSTIPGEQWLTDGLLSMSAIVRAGASSIAARGNLRSSSFRGGDFLGIGSSLRSSGSTIWVEQIGYREWQVALGMATVSGPALDWAIKLQAPGHEGPVTVAISTPTVLMKDGAQVHKDEYLELREILITGLTAENSPSMDGEVAATEAGLRMASLPFADAPVTPCDETFTISTSLSGASVLERLRTWLHFKRSSDGPTQDRWLLGLDGGGCPSWADLTVEDSDHDLALFTPEEGNSGAALRFNVHLGHDDGNELANIVATNHARRFVGYTLALVREQDGNASLSGGGVLSHGIS